MVAMLGLAFVLELVLELGLLSFTHPLPFAHRSNSRSLATMAAIRRATAHAGRRNHQTN